MKRRRYRLTILIAHHITARRFGGMICITARNVPAPEDAVPLAERMYKPWDFRLTCCAGLGNYQHFAQHLDARRERRIRDCEFNWVIEKIDRRDQ